MPNSHKIDFPQTFWLGKSDPECSLWRKEDVPGPGTGWLARPSVWEPKSRVPPEPQDGNRQQSGGHLSDRRMKAYTWTSPCSVSLAAHLVSQGPWQHFLLWLHLHAIRMSRAAGSPSFPCTSIMPRVCKKPVRFDYIASGVTDAMLCYLCWSVVLGFRVRLWRWAGISHGGMEERQCVNTQTVLSYKGIFTLRNRAGDACVGFPWCSLNVD